ncbi:protease [Clostridia bacterium]|nr:protease [Clostridia bacterium]
MIGGMLIEEVMLVVWVTVFVICLVVEALSFNLTTIWFAIAALFAFLVALFGGSFFLQIIIFIGVTALCLIVTKPTVLKYFQRQPQIRTNVDALIGKKARVTIEINNTLNKGNVVVGGNVWMARAIDDRLIISENSIVVIEAVQGVKLLVGMADMSKEMQEEEKFL